MCVAGALLLALLGAAFGIDLASGEGSIDVGGHGALSLDPHLRTDVVLSVVSAYTLGAGLAGIAKATRELDRLRHILLLDEPKFDDYRSRLFPNARALSIAGLIGGILGATLTLLPLTDSAIRQGHPNVYSLPFMALLFGLLGSMALITHRQSQVFREVGRQHIESDLLDPEAFSPFAAVGLMNAGSWFIGSAIASLLVTSSANMWIVVAVIVVTTGFGVAGLIVPSRGLHMHIRTRKREELTRIREVIANERATLFSETGRSPMPPRMNDILAYEARIEAVREWPFDTSTLNRFALFLLIPLLSWIGGALVERAVDAALN